MRNTIFISYSHQDKQWMERFVNSLRVGVIREAYQTWSDTDIVSGTDWNSEIDARISAAKVALLLVTPDFVESEYIGRRELPPILDRHRRNGLDLFWVPVKSVSEQRLRMVGLREIQSP